MGSPSLNLALLNDARSMGEDRRETWGFPRIHPPDSARVVRVAGSIASPAVFGVTSAIVSYVVPRGMKFVLTDHMHWFNDGSEPPTQFNEGSGDIVWSIQVDANYFLEGFSAMNFSAGSPKGLPVPISAHPTFGEGQLLVYLVTVVANVTLKAPAYIGAGLYGWEYPVECREG